MKTADLFYRIYMPMKEHDYPTCVTTPPTPAVPLSANDSSNQYKSSDFIRYKYLLRWGCSSLKFAHHSYTVQYNVLIHTRNSQLWLIHKKTTCIEGVGWGRILRITGPQNPPHFIQRSLLAAPAAAEQNVVKSPETTECQISPPLNRHTASSFSRHLELWAL